MRKANNMKNIMMLQLVIVFVVGIGWVKNVIKLSNCDFEAPYKAEVIYGIGLIPPVGMVTGWIDAGK